jgi:energy-coupling factor transporter ATP-binding protein EcfA2
MFRLEYLKVTGHPQLGDLELNFTEENEIGVDGSPYKSVIIGPNGTGKSYILRTIIDLFRELNELMVIGKREKYVIGYYLIKYWIDGDRFSYGNIYEKKSGENSKLIGALVPGGPQWRERGKEFYVNKNDKHIGTNEIKLPDAILANSIMLTDKFLFISKPDEFPQYRYLGVRIRNSSAGTRSLIKNTINLLVESPNNELLINKLPDVLEFLELNRFLSITYRVKRKSTFFTGKLSKEVFIDFIKKYENKRADKIMGEGIDTQAMFSYRKYKEVLNNGETLNTLIDFCNKKATLFQKIDAGVDYTLRYDVINDLTTLKKEYPIISLLGHLDLIEFPEFSLKKSEIAIYNSKGASSGESHFLNSAISILATIKDSSIILIDEPEISLHPNWQMKYLEFLRKVFKDFTKCHFIIATHSHFLISDLKGDSSKIIGLKRADGKIQIVDLPPNIDTYCWSPDDILYNIFDVTSSRNQFVAEDIAIILDTLSKGSKDTVNKIKKETYDTLIHLQETLKDKDPLKEVVKSILKKVN